MIYHKWIFGSCTRCGLKRKYVTTKRLFDNPRPPHVPVWRHKRKAYYGFNGIDFNLDRPECNALHITEKEKL